MERDPHNYQHDSVDIFISGSHRDPEKIRLIASHLQGHDFSFFHSGFGIPSGVNYRDYINHYLAHSGTILVCWSSAAANTDWVFAEAEYGRSHNKLVACKISVCDLMPPFNAFQTADLTDWSGGNDHPQWKALLALLTHRRAGNVLQFSQHAPPQPHSYGKPGARTFSLRQTFIWTALALLILALGILLGLWIRPFI